MKKRIGALLTGVIVALSLTGCGNKVKLGEYKGIEASKVICEISDAEVEEAVEEMMYDYITYDAVTDRAAETGDNVNIDYVITKVDGKPYEYAADSDDADEKDEDSDESGDASQSEDPYSGYGEDIVIGEEYVYPEVEEALVGMKTGEKKTVSAELTDDYVDEDMAGKQAEIEVTLNEISVENKPEYNDAFVKEKLGFDTVAGYEESLKKDLLEEKEEEYKYETVAQIIQKIVEASEFSGYDKKMYEACEEEYNSNNEQMAAMYGMELSDYEDLIGLSEDDKKNDIIGMVHERQIVEAIAEKEGMKISDEDVNEFAGNVYADYEYESADSFIKDYGKDYLNYYLLSQKVDDFLFDNAKLTEISEEEYNKSISEDGEEETNDGEDVEVDLKDDEE